MTLDMLAIAAAGPSTQIVESARVFIQEFSMSIPEELAFKNQGKSIFRI